MRYLLLFFSAATLFATVNEPLRVEAFSGYRNDRIHWHLQNPGDDGSLTYSELYRDIQYWQNGLTFKVIHRDLTFYMRGAYGTYGRGNLYQKYANLPFTAEDLQFQFETDGWTADGSGYFGYAVNLTAQRTYKVIITPLIGYCGYFEQLNRKGTPLPIDGFSSTLNGKFRLVWNGVFFGGGFTVEPGNNVVFNVGYSYHMIHNQVKTSRQNTREGITNNQKIKTSSGGNMGQTGWAQVDWLLGRYWRLGMSGDIHYFSSRVVDATVEQTGVEDFSQKFKLRWTPISASVQISRVF